MDNNFLEYYSNELSYLRQHSAEFAEDFPKIASRLKLSKGECQDPYIERLIEAFAFLTARINKKFDESLPRLSESILTSFFPIPWSQIPSMSVIQIKPNLANSELANGLKIPTRTQFSVNTSLKSETKCKYSTSSDITLWPIDITEAEYITKEIDPLSLPAELNAKSAIRIKLKNLLGLPFSSLNMEELPIYLDTQGELSSKILESIVTQSVGILFRNMEKDNFYGTLPAANSIDFFHLSENTSLLPPTHKQFSGFRLLLEYFTSPSCFKFFKIKQLHKILHLCKDDEIELFILLDRRNEFLINNIERKKFKLFCVPVANIFKKRTDRIHIDKKYEYHVLPDRTTPLDYEVYSINEVHGVDENNDDILLFEHFFHSKNNGQKTISNYFNIHRRSRISNQNDYRRSSYLGTEVYLSLSGNEYLEKMQELNQLSVSTWCTNRDLPLFVSNDSLLTSDTTGLNARFLFQPTRPNSPLARDKSSWTAINYLNFSYLNIFEDKPEHALSILKEMLRLYCPKNNSFGIQQVEEGLDSVEVKRITSRFFENGFLTFVKGYEINITFDEYAFSGIGCFILGTILADFFSNVVSINSFVQIIISTQQRGEIFKWKPEIGKRKDF